MGKEAIMTRYRLSCGCVLTRPELKQKSSYHSKRLYCPAHPDSRVLSRVGICRGCGTEFDYNTRGMHRLDCLCCRGMEPWKIYELSRKDKIPKAPVTLSRQASVERSDCAWRDNCTYRCGAWDIEVLPCLDCTRYMPEIHDIGLVVSRTYDPFERAVGVI
jgi:hypothetical protein